ncbi:hypothetical protein LSAT2_009397 [Lamellibrachia satsuma]|nr:hypothetical protein LSAT2_009397 [Lamellibrachia satsuma]
MVEKAGGTVPQIYNKYSPIGTWDWRNPKSPALKASGCWIHVTSSSRGDVVGVEGHVGIVVGGGYTISALKLRVEKNHFGFEAGQKPVFWRYTC